MFDTPLQLAVVEVFVMIQESTYSQAWMVDFESLAGKHLGFQVAAIDRTAGGNPLHLDLIDELVDLVRVADFAAP